MSEETGARIPSRVDRGSAEAAKRVVEEVLPETELRHAVLDLLVESIRHAHAAKPGSWGLTLHSNAMRLNVGSMEAFYFTRQKDRAGFYLAVYEVKLTPSDKESLTRAGVEFSDEYKVIPSSSRAFVPAGSMAFAVPLLRDAHLSLVETAARTIRTRSPWHETHSPGATGYLRRLGYEVPEPDYTKSAAKGQDRAEQFAELFGEFSVDFLDTDKGRKHISVYEGQRDEARRNFEDITARANGGEDVTNLVLQKLLPHGDTKGNRERGSWIHVAPAITKDVKMLFEGTGWAKAEDWPRIAQAVLHFVRRAVADPSQLAEACNEFSALAYSKGLQMGFLTPILNALRPEDFLIVNGKSRAVINYFAGVSYPNRLTAYPTLNEVGHNLIGGLLVDALKERAPSGVRDSDLFDMFSHWLVAIKKFDFGVGRRPSAPRYWKVAPGEDAWQWGECSSQGFIAIGWSELGDLSGLTREEFEARRDEMLAEHEDWTKEGVEQAWKFAQVREGDHIVANHGTTKVLGSAQSRGHITSSRATSTAIASPSAGTT